MDLATVVTRMPRPKKKAPENLPPPTPEKPKAVEAEENYTTPIKFKKAFKAKVQDIALHASQEENREVTMGEVIEREIGNWVAAMHTYVTNKKAGLLPPNSPPPKSGLR